MFMECIHRHSMLSVPPPWFVEDKLFPYHFPSLLFLLVELSFHLSFCHFFLQNRSFHLSPKNASSATWVLPCSDTLGKDVLCGDELMNFIPVSWTVSWGKLSDCVASNTWGLGFLAESYSRSAAICANVVDFVWQSSIQPYARGISRYRSVLIRSL